MKTKKVKQKVKTMQKVVTVGWANNHRDVVSILIDDGRSSSSHYFSKEFLQFFGFLPPKGKTVRGRFYFKPCK